MRRIVLRVIDRWLNGRRVAVHTPVLSSGVVQIIPSVGERDPSKYCLFRDFEFALDLLAMISYSRADRGR